MVDKTIIDEVTKISESLCTHLSISNIIVPKIDAYTDIFDFIVEYEQVTATLPDSQKNKLLVKAFPPGRFRAWYDKEIKPNENSETWQTIKTKIIERYSGQEDKDRHFKKLQTLKFNPEGHIKLLDFVEELLYSFIKAFPTLNDEDTQIRYIKSNLPPETINSLLSNSDFSSAKSVNQLFKAIKLYDHLKINQGSKESQMKMKPSDLTTLIKEIVKGIQKEGETTRNAVAALHQSPRLQASSPNHEPHHQNFNDQRRDISPARQGYYHSRERSSSPHNSRQRPASPNINPHSINRPWVDQQQNYHRDRNASNYNQANINLNRYQQSLLNDRGIINRSPSPQRRNYNYNERRSYQDHNGYQQTRNENPPAFNVEQYYKKFGVPPTPCSNCGFLHWQRHCIDHLN